MVVFGPRNLTKIIAECQEEVTKILPEINHLKALRILSLVLYQRQSYNLRTYRE